MSEGSAIARVKGVCSQQTIQRMMSLVINATRRQGETDGDGEVGRVWQSPERSFVWSFCPCFHRIFVVLHAACCCDGAMVRLTKHQRGRRDDTGGWWQGLNSLSVQSSTLQGNFPATHLRDGTHIQRHLAHQ